MARAGLSTATVVEAAADLADEAGWDRLTLSAVAKRFRVADASLYSHVQGLADVRAQIATRSALEFADRIAMAVAGRSGQAALVAFAGAYRDFARAHPGRYAATQVQLSPEATTASAGHRRIIEVTHALLRGYGLTEPAATDAARLLHSAFHGFVSLETAGGFGQARDLDASWRQAVAGLHVCLIHWPALAARGPQPAGRPGRPAGDERGAADDRPRLRTLNRRQHAELVSAHPAGFSQENDGPP